MSYFEKLQGRTVYSGTPKQPGQPPTEQEMRTEIGRIQADPGAYLQNLGFTIPQGMTDPRQITQHLLQSGQVGQGRLQQVMRMLGR